MLQIINKNNLIAGSFNNFKIMLSVIRFGNDRPTKCPAFVRIIKDAAPPSRTPIAIDPQQSKTGVSKNELAETAANAIKTPVTAAASSRKTTFKPGSPLERTIKNKNVKKQILSN